MVAAATAAAILAIAAVQMILVMRSLKLRVQRKEMQGWGKW
jgi:hypothetical protein